MARLFSIATILLVLTTCTKKQRVELPVPETQELVDVRINHNGTTRIQGRTVGMSAIQSHFNQIEMDSSTTIRLVFSDAAYTGVVNKVLEAIYRTGKNPVVTTKMLSEEEFTAKIDHQIQIDLLANDRILFDGTPLYSEDLKVALLKPELASKQIRITISDSATFGQVTEVQKVIVQARVQRVIYTERGG